MYIATNDPGPQMIPRPEMIPHFEPQMIPPPRKTGNGMELVPRVQVSIFNVNRNK